MLAGKFLNRAREGIWMTVVLTQGSVFESPKICSVDVVDAYLVNRIS